MGSDVTLVCVSRGGNPLAEVIWFKLNISDYIIKETFTQKCLKGIRLGGSLHEYEPLVNEIFKLTLDVWAGVWESAQLSACFGSYCGWWTHTKFSKLKS